MTKTTTVLAILAVALTTTIGTTPAFADFQDYVWSRDSGDGHLGFLNCSGDNCDLKLKTTSGIQIHSQSTINTEVNSVATEFDSVGKKMSIDRVTTADSIIHQANLASGTNGYTDYERHCTAWFIWCYGGLDDHYVKMDVKINDNASEVKFLLAEDSTASPQEWDVRKTLGHELWHAMGMDHDNGDTENLSYYVYVFGSTKGYEITSDEENNLETQYP